MKQKMWLMLWFAGLLYLVRYCNTHGNTAHCQITFIFSKAMMRSFADTLHESVNIWHNHCDNLRKTISHSFKITPSLSSIGLSIWNVCDLIVRFLSLFLCSFHLKDIPQLLSSHASSGYLLTMWLRAGRRRNQAVIFKRRDACAQRLQVIFWCIVVSKLPAKKLMTRLITTILFFCKTTTVFGSFYIGHTW